MKFPYGIYDFKKIITEDYFYCDRTGMIPLIEKAGTSVLFLRPRRFGKSLLLSMLENYYDIKKKDLFNEIFGKLDIGKNPTKLRNNYFVLKFDFSCVDSSGSVKEIKQSLYDHVNSRIKRFIKYYQSYLTEKIEINPDNALSSLESLLTTIELMDPSIYLLIDEYDNFANELMLSKKSVSEIEKNDDSYTSLVKKDGPLKTLFKAIKAGSNSNGFDRAFITGVSPVVMSDITSGYNIAEDIYSDEEFNGLCGFYESDVLDVLNKISESCSFDKEFINNTMFLIKKYFNGHKFSLDSEDHIYNPTLTIRFLKTLFKTCKPPRQMLDVNLAVDNEKIAYIVALSQGKKMILNLCEKDSNVEVSIIQNRFGIKDLLSDSTKDNLFIASYLYYVGALTIFEENTKGKIRLRIPNLIMKSLYIDKIQQMLFPKVLDRDSGKLAAEEVYTNGNIEPLCSFIENNYFPVFDNRDYKWANELTVKTIFLSLLYNDILYIMDSETEINRKYIDLTMILRPDKRHFQTHDILIEFKYVKLSKANLSGEQAKKLTLDELKNINCIKKAMDEAKEQSLDYAKELAATYRKLSLKSFAVVCIGFERLYWEKVN
ncbi:AAA-ATPase [Candidatus Magnetomorum sp. HK-1]|nr:AAA-ATPase [Candidatus Magnetomorum sp. HK-1]